jgi:hypothetical protein
MPAFPPLPGARTQGTSGIFGVGEPSPSLDERALGQSTKKTRSANPASP